MTTKLYLHNAANALSGTFPTGEQSPTFTAGWTATGANTLRTMDTTIGVSQASLAGTTLASTSAQTGFLGFFCSPALSGAQTVGGSTFDLLLAVSESNLNANFGPGSFNVYVWRPGTGAKVGTIWDGIASTALEPGSASSEQVTGTFNVTATSVSAADGDVIVCEVWSSFTQGMATAYTATIFYDGTTENTTTFAVVSNYAAYLSFPETLTFKGAATTAVGASSGTGAATGVGAAAANSPGSSAGVGAATGVGRSAAASAGSSSGVGAASAVGTDLRSSVGSSAGTGAAAGVGASAAKSPGSAAGVGAASGVGASTAASVGASAGVGSATATGASTARAVGSAAGTSTVTGIAPAAATGSVGSAAGVGAASGVGTSLVAAVGSAAGTSTAQAASNIIPLPTVDYQGDGKKRRRRRDKTKALFDSIEASLRESIYGPDEEEPDTTVEAVPVAESINQLETLSIGHADLAERLAVLRAELSAFKASEAVRAQILAERKRIADEEDDEEAWLMVA